MKFASFVPQLFLSDHSFSGEPYLRYDLLAFLHEYRCIRETPNLSDVMFIGSGPLPYSAMWLAAFSALDEAGFYNSFETMVLTAPAGQLESETIEFLEKCPEPEHVTYWAVDIDRSATEAAQDLISRLDLDHCIKCVHAAGQEVKLPTPTTAVILAVMAEPKDDILYNVLPQFPGGIETRIVVRVPVAASAKALLFPAIDSATLQKVQERFPELQLMGEFIPETGSPIISGSVFFKLVK